MPSFSGAKSGYKPKKTLTKPQSPTSLGAPYTSTRWGDTINSVSPAVPSDPILGIADLLQAGLNAKASEGGMSAVFNQVNSGTNGGGGTVTQTSGGTGGNGGGSTTTGGSSLTGPTSTYQERFGGSPSSYDTGYTPAGLNEITTSGNYDVLIADMLKSMGITNPELIKQLSEQAGFGALIDMIAGGDPSSGASTQFITDYVNQMMTPGGAVPTFDELTSMLLGGQGTAAAQSIAANAGVNDINKYVMDLLQSVGGNPYYQRAMYGALDANQRDYNSTRYRGGEQGTYADYLNQRGLFG